MKAEVLVSGNTSFTIMIRAILLVAYFISLYVIIFWLSVLIEKRAPKPKPIKAFPRVTICIPAYNEEKNIAETLSSIAHLDYPRKKLQIIVVNDGSKDKTREEIEKFIKKHRKWNIEFIEQKNKGKAAAMNAGLKTTRGEYFVSLDADCSVSKDALKKILPYFCRNVGAVLPLIKVKDKDTIMRKIQWGEYVINFFYKKLIGELDCIHVTPGPFSVYKTKIMKDIGGYDEGNLTEDLEIALKIQKRNYKIVQILSTTIYTKAPATLRAFCKQRNRWYKGSVLNLIKYREMLFNKKYGDLGTFFLPMILISAIASITLLVVTGIFIIARPLVLKVNDLFVVGFDINSMFQSFINHLVVFDIDYAPLFLGIILFIFSFIFLLMSYRHGKESIKKNIAPIALYLFLYPFIIGVIWVVVFFDIAFRRRQRW